MCMVVYTASEVPLRTRPFDAARPGFHVTDVPSQFESVKGRFSKPFVYYAGSHEGCGCGFQYGRQHPVVEDDREELVAADASRRAIEAFAREALERQPAIEIYACWSGDEAEPPATESKLEVPSFPDGFKEREFLVVGRPAT